MVYSPFTSPYYTHHPFDTKILKRNFYFFLFQYPTCQELLQSICALTNLHLDLLFARSFIQIYVYLHLRQTPDVAEKCLKFISEQTGKSVSYFLTQDAKVCNKLPNLMIKFQKKMFSFVANAF